MFHHIKESGSVSDVVSAFADYSSEPDLLLTDTAALVGGFTEEIEPVGITQSGGLFTINVAGLYELSLETGYWNYAQNPVGIIVINIVVQADNGSGFVDVLNRTTPISAATNPSEPAVLSFFTRSIRRVVAGTVYRVYVSALDGLLSPVSTSLIRMKVCANRLGK